MSTIEKLLRLCILLIFFFFLCGGCKDRDILLAFFTNLSNESIYLSTELREKWPYLQNYLSIFFSTQCIILLLFLLFSQIKIGGGHFEPPSPIITKVYLRLIITKVKDYHNIFFKSFFFPRHDIRGKLCRINWGHFQRDSFLDAEIDQVIILYQVLIL